MMHLDEPLGRGGLKLEYVKCHKDCRHLLKLNHGKDMIIRWVEPRSISIIDQSTQHEVLVNIDNITAITTTELKLKRVVVGRKKVKCLVIYWQDDTNPGAANQWKHINLINPSKGKLNDEHSCPVSKLYEKMMQVMRAEVYKIVELPKNPAPIQGAVVGKSYDLLITKRYAALILRTGSISDGKAMCKELADEIYEKGRDIEVVKRRISQEMDFELRTKETIRLFRSESITRARLRDTMQRVSPPTPPSLSPQRVNPLGALPTVIENPHILVEPPASVLIYPNLTEDLLKIHKDQMDRQSKLTEKARFNYFISNMPIKPKHVVAPVVASDSFYGPPCIRYTSESGGIRPLPKNEDYKNNYPETHVEFTLVHILKEMLNFTNRQTQCPFGMTNQERQVFCMVLDLLGHTMMMGKAWMVFAQRVIPSLNQDDLDMIERFSFNYRYPVVEILLKHWHKMFSLHVKDVLPAVKYTIQNQLLQMERHDILERVGWLNEDIQ